MRKDTLEEGSVDVVMVADMSTSVEEVCPKKEKG